MVRDTVTAEMWLEELVVLVGFERLVVGCKGAKGAHVSSIAVRGNVVLWE